MAQRHQLAHALFLLNGVLAGLAAVVLVVAPKAIPAVAGVPLAPPQFLICYLVAGAEIAIAAMCFDALRSMTSEVVQLTARTLIALHVSTSALAIVAIIQGASTGIWWNIGLRIIIALLLYRSIRAQQAT